MKSAWLLARASGEYAHDRRIYQLVKLQQYCKNQGMKLAGVTELSSEMPVDFHSILEDMKKTDASVLIATSISRFTKDMVLLQSTIDEFEKVGMEIHTMTEGNLGEFFKTFKPVLSVLAKTDMTVEDHDIVDDSYNREEHRQRIREMLRQKTQGGKDYEKTCKHSEDLEHRAN